MPANPKVTLLGVDAPLKCEVKGTTLTIEVPPLMPQKLPCRYNYTFKVEGAELLKDK